MGLARNNAENRESREKIELYFYPVASSTHTPFNSLPLSMRIDRIYSRTRLYFAL